MKKPIVTESQMKQIVRGGNEDQKKVTEEAKTETKEFRELRVALGPIGQNEENLIKAALKKVETRAREEGRREEMSRHPNPSHSIDEVVRLVGRWLPDELVISEEASGDEIEACNAFNRCRKALIGAAKKDGYIINKPE